MMGEFAMTSAIFWCYRDANPAKELLLGTSYFLTAVPSRIHISAHFFISLRSPSLELCNATFIQALALTVLVLQTSQIQTHSVFTVFFFFFFHTLTCKHVSKCKNPQYVEKSINLHFFEMVDFEYIYRDQENIFQCYRDANRTQELLFGTSYFLKRNQLNGHHTMKCPHFCTFLYTVAITIT